jgi:hypothetical protein
MSKYNPEDGMEVGTDVIVVGTEESERYYNDGDYGTIIKDDGDDLPKVRFSNGEDHYAYLDEIRPAIAKEPKQIG